MVQPLKVISLIILLGCMQNGMTQSRNDNWILSNHGGLDLTSSPATVLSGGNLFFADAGGSISDQSGNLLFYTNGDTIWDSQHSVMPNGTGIMGDPGHMVIVPDPGNSDQYYIFSVDKYDPFNDPDASFGYSVVDMSLNSGFGEVVLKNILLDMAVGEKVAATLDQSGTGYWVVVHKLFSDEFNSYHVGPSGITLPPVVSMAGSVYPSTVGAGGGQLQFSRSGGTLVTWTSGPALDLMQFCKFSIQTGDVFDAIEIPPPINIGFDPTGMEISPSGQFVYSTSSIGGVSWLHQVDLSTWDSAFVHNSRIPIDSLDNGGSIGGWVRPQLASDDKIYVQRNILDTIAVINDPDMYGSACDFDKSAIAMPEVVFGSFPNQIHYYHDDDVGIEEANASSIQVFPNPSDQQITIVIPDVLVGAELDLLWQDATGRIVRHDRSSYSNRITLDPGLISGFYSLTIALDGKVLASAKLVRLP